MASTGNGNAITPRWIARSNTQAGDQRTLTRRYVGNLRTQISHRRIDQRTAGLQSGPTEFCSRRRPSLWSEKREIHSHFKLGSTAAAHQMLKARKEIFELELPALPKMMKVAAVRHSRPIGGVGGIRIALKNGNALEELG
jgi:hypothetical protein